ncbi:MAG: polymer-forming cytoskeletal protein [Bdellovibrionota bacterium]
MAFWNKKELENLDKQKQNSSSTARKAESTEAAIKVEATNQLASNPFKTMVPTDSGSDFENIRSALSKGTVIQGKLSFDTPVRIDGKLSGEVYSSETVVVGPTGEIDAKIEVKNLIVMGKVSGSISVTNRTEIMSGGELNSDIFTKTISMKEGAIFNGSCTMGTEKVAELHNKSASDKNKEAKEVKKAAEAVSEVRVH